MSACAKLDEASLNVKVSAMDGSELEDPELTVDEVIAIVGLVLSPTPPSVIVQL